MSPRAGALVAAVTGLIGYVALPAVGVLLVLVAAR